MYVCTYMYISYTFVSSGYRSTSTTIKSYFLHVTVVNGPDLELQVATVVFVYVCLSAQVGFSTICAVVLQPLNLGRLQLADDDQVMVSSREKKTGEFESLRRGGEFMVNSMIAWLISLQERITQLELAFCMSWWMCCVFLFCTDIFFADSQGGCVVFSGHGIFLKYSASNRFYSLVGCKTGFYPN